MQLNRDLTIPAGNQTADLAPAPADPSGWFDPSAGSVAIEPLGSGTGWWAGAPSALWTGDRYYLSHRLRRPQPERGGTTRIAVSNDGVHFEPIWTATKDDFDTPSIERSALVQIAEDHWRLYVSYVDGADGRWRIDLLEATKPDAFNPADRRPILTAADIGGEAVKDPWVARTDTGWVMIASFVPTPDAAVTDDQMHGTKDIYNTGVSQSLSGIATSPDGLTWTWEGAVFEPQPSGWDSYAARLNTVVATPDGFVGFYDGSASVNENYEERCGVAFSTDLRSWDRHSSAAPAIGSAGGPGTVRYVEAIQTRDWTRFFYEFTRPDGAHELRTAVRTTTT